MRALIECSPVFKSIEIYYEGIFIISYLLIWNFFNGGITQATHRQERRNLKGAEHTQ